MAAKLPDGYTEEELERDNPFNAWMQEDVDDPENPDGETSYCPICNGSGEGQHEGTRCYKCKGRGE